MSRSDVSALIENVLENHGDVLEHHGVPGMKWGRRRARSSGDGKGLRPGAKGSKPSADKSSDFKKTQDLRGKKVSQLSDKQLKKINERMNMEKNYKKLNPTQIQKGHTTAKEVVAIATTTAAAIGIGAKLLKTKQGQKLVNKGARMVLNQRAARTAIKLGYKI